MRELFLLMLALSALAAAAAPEAFTQPYGTGPHWSIRNGLTLALHGAGIPGEPGGAPRGLIRIVLPMTQGPSGIRSLNFIAVEPCVVGEWRDLSELQNSPSDGKQGIKFWFGPVKRTATSIRQIIRMEKFANGAHPYLIAELNADKPMEVRFEIYAEKDSAPMTRCILTATMGNLQRLRRLHLKDRTVLTDVVLPQDPGDGFTPHAVFPLAELKRDSQGAVVEANGTEDEPWRLSRAIPFRSHWRYEGPNFTQYWRQPEPVDKDLRVLVNARKVYWAGTIPIPGGKSFENFEMNAAFHSGQVFIYGLKRPPEKPQTVAPAVSE